MQHTDYDDFGGEQLPSALDRRLKELQDESASGVANDLRDVKRILKELADAQEDLAIELTDKSLQRDRLRLWGGFRTPWSLGGKGYTAVLGQSSAFISSLAGMATDNMVLPD